MKRLKRQELKQNDTVFHCLLRNAQINTIIVQHIRTKTIQSLTYVLTNSNKLYYRQRFTPCIDHGEQFYRYWKTIEQNIKYILSVYSMLLLSRSVQENYQTRTQFLTQSLSRVVLHSYRKTVLVLWSTYALNHDNFTKTCSLNININATCNIAS